MGGFKRTALCFSMNFLNGKLGEEYKSSLVPQNEYRIPLSNFLIKEILRIKITAVLAVSKNGCQIFFDAINLIIKLINYFFSSSADTFFPFRPGGFDVQE